MASFESHILQAKNNLDFLLSVNEKNNTNWDWQVTISYYVAVHIVSAHLVGTSNMHHRAHVDVKNALYQTIPNDIYLAYTKLENLSRRARYLISDNIHDHSQVAFFTYDVHFGRAIKHLDKLIEFFTPPCQLQFGNPIIKCPDLSSNTPLQVFKVVV